MSERNPLLLERAVGFEVFRHKEKREKDPTQGSGKVSCSKLPRASLGLGMHQRTMGYPGSYFHVEWIELPQPLRTILKAAEWKASNLFWGSRQREKRPQSRGWRDSKYLWH